MSMHKLIFFFWGASWNINVYHLQSNQYLKSISFPIYIFESILLTSLLFFIYLLHLYFLIIIFLEHF